MPGWKLPLAVGTRWPILSCVLALSVARTCGDCSTRVLLRLSVAWKLALGNTTEYWPLERCRIWFSAMPPVVVVGVEVVPVVVVVVVLVEVDDEVVELSVVVVEPL